MLRWIGGLTCALALLVPGLWLELGGASGREGVGIVLAFVPVLLAGSGVWMWGMVRAEAREAEHWARVDAAVSDARGRLVAEGRMPAPVRDERAERPASRPRPRPRPERLPKPPQLPAPVTAAARIRAG